MTPQIRAIVRTSLTLPQKMLLVALASYCGEWCWPAVKTLAHQASCSEDTARRHLRALAASGWIDLEERSWAPHRYRICWGRLGCPPPGQVEPEEETSGDVSDESSEDSQSATPGSVKSSQGLQAATAEESHGATPVPHPATPGGGQESHGATPGEGLHSATQITPSTTITILEVTPTSLEVPRAKQSACQEPTPPSATGDPSAGGGGGWPPSPVEKPVEAAGISVEEAFPKDYARALKRSKLPDLGAIARRSRSAVAAKLGTWASRGRLDEIGATLAENGLSYAVEGFVDPADRPGGGGKVLAYRARQEAEEADPNPGVDAPEDVKEAWMRRNHPHLYDEEPKAEVHRG